MLASLSASFGLSQAMSMIIRSCSLSRVGVGMHANSSLHLCSARSCGGIRSSILQGVGLVCRDTQVVEVRGPMCVGICGEIF